MGSERQGWRKDVRNWQKKVDQVSQGLEGSKVEASDFVGERPVFRPSPEYLGMIASQASHLLTKMAGDNISSSKRARMETQLSHYRAILSGGKTNPTVSS